MPGNHLAPSALFYSRTWEGWEKALASVGYMYPPGCLLYPPPDVFCAGAKTIPDRAFVHTHEQWFWREFCYKAKLCHTAPILKIVRPISDRFLSAALSRSVKRYSDRSGSKWVTATETHQDGSNKWEVQTTTPIWCLMCLNDLFQFCAVTWRSYCTS